jgi:hypothetical protein
VKKPKRQRFTTAPQRRVADTGAPPQPPPPAQSPRHRKLWVGVKAAALFLVGVAGLGASIYQLGGGPPWPTDPDIHPKDATDGSSLILPFVVRNLSTVFSIKTANFLCRADLIWAQDSHGQRLVVTDIAIPLASYDIPDGGEPINVPCDTSRLLRTNADGSLSLGGSATQFVTKYPSGYYPRTFVPPIQLLKTCVFIQVSYAIANRFPHQFMSRVFQWPAVPGSHQWMEGPVKGQPPSEEQIAGLVPNFLRCRAELPATPYMLLTGPGELQMVFLPAPPPETGEVGLQIMPPLL